MAISTYAQLVSSITNWLHRTDLAAIAPDFIALAEAAFNRELRTMQMETRVTTTTGTDRYISLPSDFLELRNIKALTTPYRQLQQVPAENIDTFFASDASGEPRVFCIVGDAIYLGPAVDSSYTLEINYYASIPALATDGSNWLLTAHPDAYLYGSLMQAAPYLSNDKRLPTWAALYQKALDSIRMSDAKARWGGNVLQVRTDYQTV